MWYNWFVIRISKSWFSLLGEEFSKPYFLSLQKFLFEEYKTKKIYPKLEDIFESLNLVKFEDVKVVILGQDPYHQPNQAHGLCFSVMDGVKKPPSLVNIFKEIEAEFGTKCDSSGNLSRWAKQGVLLLNTVLTVEDSRPNSHKNKGWEQLTQKIMELVSKKDEQVIFVFCGAHAQKMIPLIDTNKHVVLTSAHPSHLSAHNGFFGNGHFLTINKILQNNKKEPIDWK